MKKQHTPWQYLVDLVSKQRLEQAHASGDREHIEQQERFYRDLDESECVFTKPYQHPDNPKTWYTEMTVRSRGFKINKLKFNTGDLANMLEPNCQYMFNRNSLNRSTNPDMYRVQDSLDTIHLLIKKGTPVAEALEMTGFILAPTEYSVVEYPTRNTEFEANGHIQVTTPIVAGRIYLTDVTRDLEAEGRAEAEELKAKAKLQDIELQENIDAIKAEVGKEELADLTKEPAPTESLDITPPVTEKELEEKPEADSSEYLSDEQLEAATKPAEPVVQQQFNQKKKK